MGALWVALVRYTAFTAVASKAVLKCLYMTRLARPELYWTVNASAREVTKWNVACDKRLHRLISYIHHNLEATLVSYVGNKPSECKLLLFCDASFAGDLKDSHSTSGALLCLVGSHTFCPISWLCKKQGAVSHSSSESEIIALDAGLRMDGIPALDLWDLIVTVLEPDPKFKPLDFSGIKPDLGNLPHEYRLLLNVDYVPPNAIPRSGRGKLLVLEDNDAVIKMVIKGRAPNFRHVARVHRVDVDWLFERMSNDPCIGIKHVGTKAQIADIFTKGSFTEQSWKSLIQLLQVVEL